MQRTTKQIVVTILFATVWGGAVTLGLHALAAYENNPGTVGRVATEWPSTNIERSRDRATLVMVAHPQCPCTLASITELAQIMAEAQGRISAYVLFTTPHDATPDWTETSLRRNAAAIPGVTVMTDVDGAEGVGFGAETSGHTLLFSADGRLVFDGGITASRGHAGENAGENAIVALAKGESPAVAKTLVFGCPTGARSVPGNNGTAVR